jgi:HD-GYP domain-containing protein (c-di-GMP phosphodiesterase class II)
MELVSPPELESVNAAADGEVLPRSHSVILSSKPLQWFVGTNLLIVALMGLLQLTNFCSDTSAPVMEKFFLSVGLIAVSLLLLGILIGNGARYAERMKLIAAYKARQDIMKRRISYRDSMLQFVADHQPGAVTVFDSNNRYLFINQRAAENIDKQTSDVIGKLPARVLEQDKARKLEARLALARASDHPIKSVEQNIDEKGNTRFIQTHYDVASPFSGIPGCVLIGEQDQTSLIIERERRERMLRQVIDTLVAVVDRRDPYAAGHSARVGQLARAIANEMGLSAELVGAAEIAGSLMNFGKILVSRRILTKTTTLEPEELQRVRDSILTSADILAIIGFEGPVLPTLRQVLERFDGSGAPRGLKGEEILITARIVTAANSFVACVSPRAHRPGLSFGNAMQSLMAEADKMYDRRVLIALANYLENRPNKLDWLMATQQA